MFLLRLVVYLSRRWGSQRLVRGAHLTRNVGSVHPTNVQSRAQISVIFILSSALSDEQKLN